MLLHLFLYDTGRGGFPAEETETETEGGGGGGNKMVDPTFPLETLPSPVIDDINDEVSEDMGRDMLKVLF